MKGMDKNLDVEVESPNSGDSTKQDAVGKRTSRGMSDRTIEGKDFKEEEKLVALRLVRREDFP